MALITCPECQRELSDTLDACPHCGFKLASPDVGVSIADVSEGTVKPKRGSKKLIIAISVIVLIVVATVFIAGLDSGPNLEQIHKNLPATERLLYAELSSDKKSIIIDTNPNDINDYFAASTLQLIKDINKELGLPDSLYDKLMSTRALDGRQVQTFNKITVSWTYHPNNGLKIIYEKN